jgi:uncharacterized protein
VFFCKVWCGNFIKYYECFVYHCPALSFKCFYDVRLVWTPKFTHKSLWIVILASWGVAFFEYCLQVPANRVGSRTLSAVHLKTIQEIITFLVFIGFSYWYLGQKVSIMQIIGMLVICVGAFLVFKF